MKNFIITAFIASLAVLGIASCDEEVVSEKHVYTEEELAYRDSVEAAKNGVRADYVFVYNLSLPADSADYRSVEVSVDTDILLEKLEYASLEEVTAALGTISEGAQSDHEITFFAVNVSTGYDYTDAFTASGFGHWFDGNGDVISWGDNAYLFSELNAETFTFLIGQFPDRLTPGDKRKIIQLMSRDDYRVAFVFNITVGDYYVEEEYVDPETPPAGDPQHVDTSYVVTQTYADDWSANSRVDVREVLRQAFKMTTYQIHTAIENNEILFYGVNSDGSVYVNDEEDTVSTATYPGHWFDVAGDVTVWGDTVSLPVAYSELSHTNEALEMSIGHHPENAEAGDEVVYKQVAELNGGKVTFTFTLKIE